MAKANEENKPETAENVTETDKKVDEVKPTSKPKKVSGICTGNFYDGKKVYKIGDKVTTDEDTMNTLINLNLAVKK